MPLYHQGTITGQQRMPAITSYNQPMKVLCRNVCLHTDIYAATYACILNVMRQRMLASSFQHMKCTLTSRNNVCLRTVIMQQRMLAYGASKYECTLLMAETYARPLAHQRMYVRCSNECLRTVIMQQRMLAYGTSTYECTNLHNNECLCSGVHQRMYVL